MPTNITRGNVEGLIAIQFTPGTLSISSYSTIEMDYIVDGVLATDVVVSFNVPYYINGVSVGNARVKSNNTISVVFVNTTISNVNIPTGIYSLVLGRLSDGYLLPTVSF